jgi:hypothetical protein
MIEELAKEESRLLDQVRAADGLMEEKHAVLRESGIYAAYSKVHQGYAALIDDPLSGREALKRALFIQWYSVSEPSCFTGIRDLDSEAEAKVFHKLDELAERTQLDDELHYMLSWYYRISDWYFDARSDVPNLIGWLDDSHHDLPSYQKRDFDDRGQMGDYWRSLEFALAGPVP